MSPGFLLRAAHYAAAGTGQAVCNLNGGGKCDTGLPNVAAGSGELKQIVQIVLGILAALAVLMLVIAGLRYITAQGNSQEVEKAKGTILYALAGLIIAVAAEAIVSLVLTKL